MKTSKSPLPYLYLIALLMVGGLAACDFYSDGGGEKEKAYQTRIIDVLVLPGDTAASGDTLTFICIIEDSLDTRFNFYWYIDEGQVLDAKFVDDLPIYYITEINSVRWVAPQKPSFYTFGVFVNNGSKDSLSVDAGFHVIIE